MMKNVPKFIAKHTSNVFSENELTFVNLAFEHILLSQTQ